MKRSLVVLAASSLLVLAACGSNSDTTGSGGSGASGSGAGATSSSSASHGGASTGGSSAGGANTGGSSTGGSSTGGGGGMPTAAQLLALVNGCNAVSNGDYKTDDDSPNADIPICGLNGAVFWKADMDIDCDGKMTAQCNKQTDAAYQNQTSATDSNGDPLDAATLQYVVVPLPSNRFDYSAGGLDLGSVIAVIYQGQLEYGVFGDEGPNDIIGEASYAMAKKLGIDPDPSTGGTDSGVTYIAFTGQSGVVGTIEDHAEAVSVGQTRAAKLLVDN